MKKIIQKDPFKKLEIDCEKEFISINGKEIDISNVSSIDIHIFDGKIEFEIVNFLSGDFGNGRAENS